MIKDKIIIHDIIQQLATVDEDIAQQFGVDLRGYFFDNPVDFAELTKATLILAGHIAFFFSLTLYLSISKPISSNTFS